MTYEFVNNLLVIVGTVLALLIVFNPRLVQARLWRATVTPLASIIGSGFLVLGPILERDYGVLSIVVMAGLCLAAYAIGAAIRFNILEHDRRKSVGSPRSVRMLEVLASWSLVFAYVISVAYYLNLFGAFAVKLTPANAESTARMVTTGALIFIGVFGYLRGLAAMEHMEEVTVGLKLAVIAGLLVGMAAYAVELWRSEGLHYSVPTIRGFRSIAVAFGLIITVQGFETSRYLGHEYDAETCVKTMKLAQWIATGIYLTYIVLTTVSFPADQIATNETAIIEMTRVVAPLLPALLIVAALSAQFSAAVADTNGSGGLTAELSKHRIPSNVAYLLLVIGAIAITWLANIFEIISYASRAFAVYYFLQAVIAVRFAWLAEQRSTWRVVFFTLVAGLCLMIIVFGVPVEA